MLLFFFDVLEFIFRPIANPNGWHRLDHRGDVSYVYTTNPQQLYLKLCQNAPLTSMLCFTASINWQDSVVRNSGAYFRVTFTIEDAGGVCNEVFVGRG